MACGMPPDDKIVAVTSDEVTVGHKAAVKGILRHMLI